MPGYSQFVAWSHEDSQYMAVCPELDRLVVLADTEEEAVRELKVAIGLVLQDMADCGETPPRPFEHGAHSGQFRIRIPRTLHARLAWLASRECISLNTLVCALLAEGSSQLNAAAYVSSRFKATYQASLDGSYDDGRSSRIADAPLQAGNGRRSAKGTRRTGGDQS